MKLFCVTRAYMSYYKSGNFVNFTKLLPSDKTKYLQLYFKLFILLFISYSLYYMICQSKEEIRD